MRLIRLEVVIRIDGTFVFGHGQNLSCNNIT